MRSNDNKNNRCAICDYSAIDTTYISQEEAGPRTWHYDKRRDEYLCGACYSFIKDSILEFHDKARAIIDKHTEVPLEDLRIDVDGTPSKQVATLAGGYNATVQRSWGDLDGIVEAEGRMGVDVDE